MSIAAEVQILAFYYFIVLQHYNAADRCRAGQCGIIRFSLLRDLKFTKVYLQCSWRIFFNIIQDVSIICAFLNKSKTVLMMPEQFGHASLSQAYIHQAEAYIQAYSSVTIRHNTFVLLYTL
jgi:hypothetical protein